MFVENGVLRIVFFILFLSFLFFLLFVSLWRGAVSFGISVSIKTIIIVTFCFFGFMLLGFSFNNSDIIVVPFFTSFIVGLLYLVWLLLPLFLLRDFISFWYKIPGLFMFIISILWIGFGIYFGTTVKVTTLELPVTSLSQDYTFVFISDLHVQALRNTQYIQSIVNKIKKIQPDFVIIGGDLFDRVKPEYSKAYLPFNQLDIPIYATLGNHDAMGSTDSLLNMFDNTNIIFLRNKSVLFSGIQLVGIDDKSFWKEKQLDDVLNESDIKQNALYTILISHQPYKLSLIKNYPIDLQLAGHTHRGQFIPLSWIIGWFNDYAYGKYDEHGKIVFVSQGIGTRGAPIRVGTQSELVLVTLKH